MIAYKLFTIRKNGTIGPLFINRKQIIPICKWVKAKSFPTKGFAIRPGWHTASLPNAPHLSMKGRVWARVEISEYVEFNRPEKQGGMWFIAKRMKVLELL